MTKDPYTDRILANRYHLLELAGKGAMGRVYRAEDTLLGGVIVAVKFLAQTLLNKRMRDRFEREATICALLAEKTIHIVRVRDYGVDAQEVPYYVMEFLEGESLSELIRKRDISLSRFLRVIRQACLGLQCAHEGIIFKGEKNKIIHRDIKPSNLLLMEDATLGELVKILDFGIAKLIEENREQTHSFMGTLAYCSPEQMEGKELDRRSDIYSLGVMMYEMLANEMPLLPENNSFGGWYKAHHDFKPLPLKPELNIPPELNSLIMQCLAKKPDDRPENMGEILKVISPLAERYDRDRHPAKIEKDTKGDRQPTPTESSLEDLCLQMTWPQTMPQQKIVFPRFIRTPKGVLSTLWIMIEQQDIFNRRLSTRYNQFLFSTIPHPMLLWITVLYSPQHGPRWLPCYLDMKTSMGQNTTRLLGESGEYRMLFFALENVSKCQHVMNSTIDPEQCKRLLHWADTSKGLRDAGQSTMSKNLLKQEFEKLKPKILMKLEAAQTQYPSSS
ncbi:serine/threonine-protein kinase [Spirulina sp. 06S082]|uniref:serine/threonine protein kinase n=1 Tax=Spirulina sp. 06S082 TaxID=3110248 RepID=UPI002B1F264E|nr:serine/threonine-protein kinase [Spirulina sp. 06S082]MEA5469710.1 serine/threonine-protein kinase [Spirulina sp. 06S082]